MKKTGFTLVELVVVLAIIAILTHLAVRELSHVRDAKLTETANRQLEEIKASVYSRTSGSEAVGFLADMGRMPRISNIVRTERLSHMLVTNATLAELWLMPEGSRPYAVRPATADNLLPGLSQLAKPSVYVPTGWRGPYLRLPPGKSRLFDPWGNPMEMEPGDDTGLTRLWTSTNGSIEAVSHYGPHARWTEKWRQPLIPDGGATSRLIVTTTCQSDISVSWYGPANGFITGAVATVSATSPAIFEGLTPGTRILYYNNAAHTIDVRPGDKLISIDLP